MLKTFVFSALYVLLIIFSDRAKIGAIQGIEVVKNAVLTVIFPSSVLIRMILSSDVFLYLSKRLAKSKLWQKMRLSDSLLLPVISGIAAGFPQSAILSGEMLERGEISKEECEKAVLMSSSPSLAFVLFAFENKLVGLLLFICITVISIAYASHLESVKTTSKVTNKKQNFSKILSLSVSSAAVISGAVIFFSVISSLFPDFLIPYVEGVFEMSRGVLNGKNLFFKVFSLSFGGFSAMSQVVCFSGVSIRKYLTLKIILAVFSVFFAFLVSKAYLFF